MPDISCSGGLDALTNTSGKLVTSNGSVQIGRGDSFVNPDSPNKGPVQSHHIDQSKGTDALDLEKSERKSKPPTERRGRKPRSSTAKTEMSGQSQIDTEKDSLEPLERNSCAEEIGNSSFTDPSSNIADVPSQHEKETTQEAGQNEMPSPLPNITESQPNGRPIKRSQRRTKNKGSKNQESGVISTLESTGNLLQDQIAGEVPPSTYVLTKKESEKTSDSESKRKKQKGKKAFVENNDDKKSSTPGDYAAVKEESREKQSKKSGKEVGPEDQDGKKNRRRGKSNLKEDLNGELSIKVLSNILTLAFKNSVKLNMSSKHF